MFIRITKNKKGDAYYHLVESFREQGKVRQRLLLALGRVEDGKLEKVDVVLYDLTTLRFESTREDLGELRKFGYSKEMRTDCTQVVLGC